MRRRLTLFLMLALAACCLVPSVALAKSSPRLTISTSSAWEHFDKKPVVTGRLTTPGGAPLAKATVKLYCGGRFVASKKTDSSGKVRFDASLPGSLMSGAWKLRYAGSRVHRAATSASKITRIHVHFEGPAGFLGDILDDDALDDGTTPDQTDDPSTDGTADDGVESGLDDGSPYALDMQASTFVDDVSEPIGGTDDAADDEDGLGEEPVPSDFLYSANVYLDGGHRYAIEVGEPSRCEVTDDAGAVVMSPGTFDDVHVFKPSVGGDFTFLFDTGRPAEELDELFVLVW